MRRPDPFLTDERKNIPRINREVRLEADGTQWTNQRDPVMRERIIDVYRKLCETGETGRQIVAVQRVQRGSRRHYPEEATRRPCPQASWKGQGAT